LKIFDKRKTYKPFLYPEAYNIWLEHEQMHWLPREVNLHEDTRDWRNKLDDYDRNYLDDILRLFTQGDVDVSGGYIHDYLPHFEHPEIRMMLLSFAAREAVHIDAYSYLNESLGKTDSFYEEFLKVPVMAAKHEFFEKVISGTDGALPIKIAGISAFTEGMFLFSSFAMLMNYPRNGLMKGMGQIVSWSVLDEQKHVEGLMYLLDKMKEEDPDSWTPEVEEEISAIGQLMAEMEMDFIEYSYAGRDEIRGLHKKDLKRFIRYTVNKRLIRMGIPPVYKELTDPLGWFDDMISSQNHENFFETRATSYAKAALTGSWGNVWGAYKKE